MKKIIFLLPILCIASFSMTAFSQVKDPKPVYRLGGFWDHWFISAGVGGQMYFGEDDNKAKLSDRISPSFQLSTGKWITHFAGVRLQIGGLQLKGWNDGIDGQYRTNDDVTGLSKIDPQWSNNDRKWVKPRNEIQTLTEFFPDGTAGDLWGIQNGYGGWGGSLYMQDLKYFDAHIDAMFNITSAIMGYSPTRVFNLIPYVGVGLAYKFDNDYIPSATTFIPNAGMMFNFRLSDAVDLGLDVKATIVDETFDGHIGGQDAENYWGQEGYMSASLNLTYKFKQRDFEVVYEMDPNEVQKLNDRINALMVPAPAPVCPECPPAISTTRTRVFLAPVHFPLDVHLVQSKEMYKVELAAKYLNDDPSRTLHLEGYADRKTGSPRYNQGISERRVREVRRILVEKYGIDPNRLTIGWQGDLKQPFDVNELNRAVLFVGDEETTNDMNMRYNQPQRQQNPYQQPQQYQSGNYQTPPQDTYNANPYTQSGYDNYSQPTYNDYNQQQPAYNQPTYNAQPSYNQGQQVGGNRYAPPAQTQSYQQPQQSTGNYYNPPAAPQSYNSNQYIAPNSGNTYQFNR